MEYQRYDDLVEDDKHIADAIHWPECWDTMTYPTLAYALWEMVAMEENTICPTCKEPQRIVPYEERK